MNGRGVTRTAGKGRRAPLWIIGSVVALVIALVVLVETFALTNMRDGTLRNTETNLTNISVALAEQASRTFRGLDLVLDNIAESLADKAAVDGDHFLAWIAGRPMHETLRDRLTGLPYVEAITVLDPHGNLINSSGRWPPLPASLADSDYVRAVRTDHTRTTSLGVPVRAGSGGGWVLPVAHAIRVRDGDLVGILVGAISLRYFDEFYRSVSLGEGRTVSLLLGEGLMLARYPATEAIGRFVPFGPQGQPVRGQPVQGQPVNDGITTTTASSAIDGELRLKAARTLTDYPLTVRATQTRDSVLREWYHVATVLGLITLGCIVCLLVAAAALGRWWLQQQALAVERAERAEAEGARALAQAALARERERHAEEASRAKSGFLAMMSHEIRTPMNGVLGLTGTLLDEPLTPSQHQIVVAIRDSGDSLLRILNDILDLSKLDAGRMELEDTAFSPVTLTHGAVSILGPRAMAKGLAINARCSPDLPPALLGDAGRLRQILLNLVSNAVKFTETGSVTIEARQLFQRADMVGVEWSVTDTGIGIAPDRLGALFGEFMQADSSITRRFGGTGLGLAISKRLIEQMGGTIGVTSTVGGGTRFWFHLTLPVADHVVERERNDGDATVIFSKFLAGRRRPLRMLFAEDNPTNQFVALQLLKDFDVQVDVVGDGLEAVDAAASFPYDVICMDMRMPEMDGLAATRLIRKRGGLLADVPIIALTANAFPEDVRACLDAGMNLFVPKPVDRPRLLNALMTALAGPASAVSPVDAVPKMPLAEVELAALDTDGLRMMGEAIGDEAIVQVVAMFQNETRDRLERLRSGVVDPSHLEREVHTLKGAAGTVSALRLERVAAAVELRLRQGGTLHEADVAAMALAFEAWETAVREVVSDTAQAA